VSNDVSNLDIEITLLFKTLFYQNKLHVHVLKYSHTKMIQEA